MPADDMARRTPVTWLIYLILLAFNLLLALPLDGGASHGRRSGGRGATSAGRLASARDSVAGSANS